MTRFAFRAIFLALKGTAFLLGGLLFGALPLLVVICLKVIKWSAKASVWTIGAVTAASLFIVRSV